MSKMSLRKNILKSNRGNAIMMTLALAGLLLAIAAALMNFLSNSTTQNGKASDKAMIADKIKQIRLLTNDIDSCTTMIRGFQFRPVVDFKNKIISPLNLGLDAAKNLQAGQFFGTSKVKIKNIFLIPTDPPEAGYARQPIEISPGAPNPFVLRKIKTKIVFDLDSQIAWNGYSPEHSIAINVRYYKWGLKYYVVSCNSATSPAEACELTTNIPHAVKSWGWNLSDRTAIDNWSCQPNRSCYGSKAGTVDDPTKCISPYKPRRIHGSLSAGSLYLCLWCNYNPN
jgi:hypothetical protein